MTTLKRNQRFIIGLACMLMLLIYGMLGCNGDNGGEDTQDAKDAPPEADVQHDEVAQQDPDTIEQTEAEIQEEIIDVTTEDVPGEPLPELPCPAACQQVPTGGQIGAPCVSSATCDNGATCIPQSEESFGGRTYTDFYKGACILYGPDPTGCDPEVPTSCPDGSVCEYMGEYMGQTYHGCWDSCIPADTSRNLYDYNCGCRPGYACDITAAVCFPGCSNNNECCERWWDLNGDGNRQPDEVVAKEGCTNTCDDGGLFSGGSETLCSATFNCINNGDPTNHIGGPCEGDAWCPADGRCLDAFRYSDDPADPTFPGGYCIKDGCNYVGRGCTDQGGACADLGSADDHFYTCVQPCHFGRHITDDNYECRKTSGQEYACFPQIPSYTGYNFWYTAPADGSDGWCWPGNFHPTGTGDLGDSCTKDEDCAFASEFGIGFCAQFSSIPMSPFCSAQCNDTVARNMAICGGDIAPDDPANNTAKGACFSGLCWEGCDQPGAALGSNGCSLPDNACYPASMFSTSLVVGNGLTAPQGICIPKCINDTWCSNMWSIATTCNTTSGVCE